MKYIVTQPMLIDCIINEKKIPCSIDKGYILKFIKQKEGITFCDFEQACSELMGAIACFNDEQLKNLEEVKEVKAESEPQSETAPKKYTLDPNKKYQGDEAIDYIVLYLQNNDLSEMITRDDSKSLFVDLGPIEMFPDADSVDWIMKLNSRIPIKTAISIGCRTKNGNKHLGIVLHDNFV